MEYSVLSHSLVRFLARIIPIPTYLFPLLLLFVFSFTLVIELLETYPILSHGRVSRSLLYVIPKLWLTHYWRRDIRDPFNYTFDVDSDILSFMSDPSTVGHCIASEFCFVLLQMALLRAIKTPKDLPCWS